MSTQVPVALMLLGSWGNFRFVFFPFLPKLQKRRVGVDEPTGLSPPLGGHGPGRGEGHSGHLRARGGRAWPMPGIFRDLSLPQEQNNNDYSKNEGAAYSLVCSRLWEKRGAGGAAILTDWRRIKPGKALMQEYGNVRKCHFPQTLCFLLLSG